MIQLLNIQKPEIAQNVWNLQQVSYQEEAKLIDFKNIPYLLESIEDLRKAKESFLGFFKEENLIGMLAYEKAKNNLEINRLVVHPIAFRQGIASNLLTHLLTHETHSTNFQVNTAKANFPAIRLYQKFDFEIVQEYVVENILDMVLMNLAIVKK